MAKGREKINHDILFEGDSQKGSLQGIERKKKKDIRHNRPRLFTNFASFRSCRSSE